MSTQTNEEGAVVDPSSEGGSTLFTGGCACGAIRYECSSEPILTFNCHCLNCQKASGSAFASCLMVPSADLKLAQGEPKYYTVTADNGYPISRGFCPECGSPVLVELPYKPRIAIIQAASLDDPSWHRPAADIYTKRAHPWDYMNPELPKFPELPPLPDSPLFEILQP
jgi:hypothetical protein